ncbi:hypothetical protein VPHD51_0097 [Vibrio phage D51]
MTICGRLEVLVIASHIFRRTYRKTYPKLFGLFSPLLQEAAVFIIAASLVLLSVNHLTYTVA